MFSRTAGGEGRAEAFGIAVDPAGQPWITGKSCGRGFPVTFGNFDFSTNCKAFVMQFERLAGTTRMSMVMGGSNGDDGGTAILPNGSSTAYVTGYVNSTAFPTTPGAYQIVRSSSGPQAFVAQVDAAGQTGRIVRCALLDASDTVASTIAPVAGAVYVGGDTASGGFVAKLKQDLTQLYYTKPMFDHVYGLASLSLALDSGTTAMFVGGRIGNAASVARLNDDGIRSQVLWHNTTTGQLSTWVLDSQGHVTSTQTLSAQCSTSNGCAPSWKVIGTIDSNRDGVGDVLLYNATTGELQVWLLNRTGAVTGIQSLSRRCGASDGCSQTWKPLQVGDFNHDGSDDILWHNDVTGALQAWLLNGAQVTNTLTLSKVCRISDGCWPRWQIIAVGDFNSDGIDDLFWYDTQTGKIDIALLDGAGNYRTTQALAKVCGPNDGCSQNWKPAGLADVNGDGNGDLLWENTLTGEVSAWLLNGTNRLLGTQLLSLRCDATSGCLPGTLPVGILRNRVPTP